MERTKLVTNIKFAGIDSWNRPVFKATNSNNYYGSVTTLFDSYDKKQDIIDYFKRNIYELEWFGTEFDCEPNGGLNSDIELNIID
jgi:GH43 family beta-xylosidase